MGRRQGLLLEVCALLVLLLPQAAAAEPMLPFHILDASTIGEPLVGKSVALRVTFDTAGVGDDADGYVRLRVPEWVDVTDGAAERAVPLLVGGDQTVTWRVMATRAGFWGAGIEFRNSSTALGGDCCLLAYSGLDRGLSSRNPLDLLPPLEASVRASAEAVDDERIRVDVTATPVGPWPPGAVLFANTQVGPSAEGPGSGPVTATAVVELGSSGSIAFEPRATAQVRFETGDWTLEESLGYVSPCRLYKLDRVAGEARLRDGPCGEFGKLLLGVPGPEPALVAVALFCLAILTRTKKNGSV